MNIDKNKLDELFSDEESSAAEDKAKSKVGSKMKVKTEKKPKAKAEDKADPDPEVKSVSKAKAASVSAVDIPDEDKETIQLNPGKITNTVFDWLGSLFIALVCVLLVMTFCFRVIDVDGTSMEPTLINSDKVVITDLFYTPHNGDVIVISHGEEYEKPLVKRVIAIAGQDLRIDFDNNAVYVDGVKLDEPYIQGVTIRGDKSEDEINGIIPEGKIFVMGDNRTVSLDSRYKSVDLIDTSSVIGKAQIVLIPHSYGEDGTPHFDIKRIRYIYS